MRVVCSHLFTDSQKFTAGRDQPPGSWQERRLGSSSRWKRCKTKANRIHGEKSASMGKTLYWVSHMNSILAQSAVLWWVLYMCIAREDLHRRAFSWNRCYFAVRFLPQESTSLSQASSVARESMQRHKWGPIVLGAVHRSGKKESSPQRTASCSMPVEWSTSGNGCEVHRTRAQVHCMWEKGGWDPALKGPGL